MRDTYLRERFETKADPWFVATVPRKPFLERPPGPTNSFRPSDFRIPSIAHARHTTASSVDFTYKPATFPSGLAKAQNGTKRSG